MHFIVDSYLEGKEVVPILEEYATTRGPISLIYPQSKQLSSKIKVLNQAMASLKI